jgi:hypothetical protein
MTERWADLFERVDGEVTTEQIQERLATIRASDE